MSDKSIQEQIGMADSFEEALRLITENPPKPEAKYNRQPVNMSLIKVDPDRLQSRVETSREVVEQYKLDLRSGDQFPPMVVFFDVETQLAWLADGFHRWHMYKELEFRWADCDVKFGTLRDAIVFAATANSKHGLNITMNDRKKSATMLFQHEDFWRKSDAVLSSMVGVSKAAISAWRHEYSIQNKIAVPDSKIGRCGVSRKRRSVKEVRTVSDALAIVRPQANGRSKNGISYYLRHQGEHVYLGFDESSAKEKAKEMFLSGWFSRNRKPSKTPLNQNGLYRFLLRRGIRVSAKKKSSFIGFQGEAPSCLFWDFAFQGGVIRVAESLTQSNFSGFVGDLFLSSSEISCRRVVLCHPPAEVMPMVRLANTRGIEFLTPEEFADSFPKNEAEAG